VVTFGYSGNNSDALLDDMMGPPHKSRGIKQALCNCILSYSNWVALLEIYQELLDCCPIFTFNTQVSTLGCFPNLLVASMLDVHISRFNGMTILLIQIFT
jgi:hypothetical protein